MKNRGPYRHTRQGQSNGGVGDGDGAVDPVRGRSGAGAAAAAAPLTEFSLAEAQRDEELLSGARGGGGGSSPAVAPWDASRAADDAPLLGLPPRLSPGLSVKTFLDPAWDNRAVGGTFFETLALAEDRIALTVGAVSARGLDAAAYAEEVRAALRECLRQSPDDPAAALACLNDAVARVDASADRERMGETYASTAVAVVDTVTGVMDCACAGMEPPFVLRPSSGEAIQMGAGCGPLLGARAGAAYHTQSFALWRGDLLVLAGDGLAEARGIGGRVFGRDRLVAAVREAHLGERPLAEVGEAVIQRVKTFTGRRPYEDVCLLLARRV